MDVGYHHASFRSPDEPDRPMIDATVDRAHWLESEGFAFLSMMDHLWQIPYNGRRDEPFLDCYTALPAVAQATSTIELSALVTCPHYRNPGYLGRAIASLDHIADGRAVFGVGAGWNEAEYEALDLAFPDVPTRNRQMRETIELCRAMWTEPSPVTYEGEHYELNEFYCEPKPAEIPVLVGGGGEQLTLRAAAEYADRWNVPTCTPEAYDDKLDVLRDHCRDCDRDYDAIEKTLMNTTLLREDGERAHEVYEELLGRTDAGSTPREEYRGAVGTPSEVADLLSEFAAVGLDTYVLKVPSNDQRTLELFVDEVLEALP